MSKIAMTETYFDVQETLRGIVYKFVRQYGGRADDLLADANLLFCEAYNKYDRNIGDFEKWVRYYVWKNLLEAKRLCARRLAKLPRISSEELHNMGEEQGFDILRILRNVSADAAKIIRLVVDTAEELPGVLSLGVSPASTKRKLLSYLNALGWDQSRIQNSFKEIADAIS